MADPDPRLLSALTTEHFVLQSAINATVSEAGARSTLYMMALSSSLVAVGFLAPSSEALMPFLSIVLPTLFMLGVFTVIRLIDTALEAQQYLAGIARVHSRYRALSPEAAQAFAPRLQRWPETDHEPSLGLGRFMALLGTSATMIACTNNLLAGAGVALLLAQGFHAERTPAVVAGLLAFTVLSVAFYAFERWRFDHMKPRLGQFMPMKSRG
ncbi:MAG TPA: hypothetical protein VMT14_12950 [Burkholderiaceae bacterium]|nr:hypothetical protein [Burkholderiaceae bacterium]